MEDKEVQDMFHRFNQQYFWGTLRKVKLNWSKNMTLCAGKTYCKERRGSTFCSIYLSQPLLTQRPPEDTVNTLLHEMIHAYLFVTVGGSHKMGHGPAFREHMTRINKLHGSKITVFHNFRKEVDKFRIHVYRCDGPCTKRKPFFGVLRRAITRPPGPTDRWWTKHKQECGGTFHKVEGPDIISDADHNTNVSVKAGSLGYQRTSSPNCSPSLKRTPSPNNTSSPKHTLSPYHTPSPQSSSLAANTPQKHVSSKSYTPSQNLTPSAKTSHSSKETHSGTSQSGKMAAKHPGDDHRKTFSGVRKRLGYDCEEKTDITTISEDELIQKIKQRHAHTSRSVLLSKEEARMIRRGNSPERGTLVEGWVNYNYRPKSRGNLNIHKYLRRYKAFMEAAGILQRDPVLQKSQATPTTHKSPVHQLSDGDSTWRVRAAQSSHSSLRDNTHTDITARTSGSSFQATVPPCVTCWNCGVNVMVAQGASQKEEDSCKLKKVSAHVEKKSDKSVSPKLVACPSCGEKVPEEQLNTHLDECLMPFTDEF